MDNRLVLLQFPVPRYCVRYTMAILAETLCSQWLWTSGGRASGDSLCDQCFQSGKNLKCLHRQKQVGKFTEASEHKEEFALDFSGPFQNEKKGTKYLLVTIDHNSDWPEAKFSHRPKTKDF